MARFADLGIPFPLFEAETQEAYAYCGFDICFLCQREQVHCFAPSTVLVACQHCATENDLEVARDISYHVGGTCMRCASPLPSGKGLVCYTCLGWSGLVHKTDGVRHGTEAAGSGGNNSWRTRAGPS